MADALNIFLSYSRDDEAHLQELLKHLALLQRQGLIHTWHDREISAGDAWRGQIDEELEAADVILLLVSPSFIASDYCWDVETQRALERHTQGEARVIPMIVRPCEWRESPFAELQVLPQDGLPVTSWEDPDQAWLSVASGVRRALTESAGNPWMPVGERVDPAPSPRRAGVVEAQDRGIGISGDVTGAQVISGDQVTVNIYSGEATEPSTSDPLVETAQPPVEEPQPKFRDVEARRLSERLSTLYQRREELAIGDGDTQAIDSKILDVRRLLREGPQLQPGEFLGHGRYRLLEPVGQGGFAMVWKAWDTRGRHLVAVKVLHGQFSEDRSRRERFFRGARKMDELEHPHIVRVLLAEGGESGWHFFVMEYLGGGNFEQAVLRGDLNKAERLEVVLQIGEALEYTHERGVVHRDVKPANILLDEGKRAKLTDFDLVRAGDTTGMTRSQAMMGTLQFAAPEALESAKEAEPSADVYSLGATAVFALRGERLPSSFFRDPGFEIRALGVEEKLEGVLLRATAPVPRDRFESVKEFCKSLVDASQPGFVSEPQLESVEGDSESKSVPGATIESAPVLERRPTAKSTTDSLATVREPKVWQGWPDDRLLLALALVLAMAWASWPNSKWQLDGVAPHPGSIKSRLQEDTPQVGELSEFTPLGIDFRYIPASTFIMGSPMDEPGRERNETQHRVAISHSFWMGETEITQKQWSELASTNPSHFQACGKNCPVENVNWYEALWFANELSKREKLPECYVLDGCIGTAGKDLVCKESRFEGVACLGYRLPTEAEWELAARSGTPGAIYKGEFKLLGTRNAPALGPIAWYGGNSGVDYEGGHACSDWPEKQTISAMCGTHPVGEKEANEWELRDMLGNVYEWNWDWYGQYPSGSLKDPLGAPSGRDRVFRGGAWGDGARSCRAATRGSVRPDYRLFNVGFRLVRTALPLF